ncbi:MAG: DUF4446 family protein [Nocardioidaceae bacterium]
MTWWLVLDLVVSLVALGLALLAWRRASADGPAAPDDAVPADLLGLRREVSALRAEGRDALRHVSVVRYDAFPDVGGHQSWSVALLDDAGDGVVLTSIHGRSDARSYAKTVAAWSSEQPLSPEEEQALSHARA